MKSGVSGTKQTSSQSTNRGFQFRQAAFKGDIRELERLFSPELIDEPGHPSQKTALHLASAHGKIGAVKWLLAYGAKTDLKDKDGNTPFLLALTHHHTKITDYFIEKQGAAFTLKEPPATRPFRLPPLVFLTSNTGTAQTQAILRSLPYLQALGYKGFFSDILMQSSIEEMIHFFRDMSLIQPNSRENYSDVKKVFEAVKQNPWLTFHRADTEFVQTPTQIIPPPSFMINGQFKIAEKILSLAEEYDGGIICYLSFSEHPALAPYLKEKLKEKASQFIFYAETALETFMHSLHVMFVSQYHNNFHYLSNEAPNALDIAFREPILAHFQQHTRDKYYTKPVASGAVLTKLKSLYPDFEELETSTGSFDAVLPVADIADFKQKSAIFSHQSLLPALCMRKRRDNPMEQGILSLTLENIETPANQDKVFKLT